MNGQQNIGVEIESQDDDIVWVWSEFRDKEMVKSIPGARWDQERKQWRLPRSWGTCKALRGVFGERLVVGPELAAWATAEVTSRVNPALTLRTALNAEGDERLYPFQRAGVEFLLTAGNALLADEMGTGKTVQVASALRTLVERGVDPFPCLVVAPNSVKSTWVREIETWMPGTDVRVIAGGAAGRKKRIAEVTQVGVINYEATWRSSRLAGYGNIRLTDREREERELNEVPWRTVVVDEAHRIKNPRAKQTRAIWYLGHQPTVERRWALTGTPMANAPDDLWSLLHFLEPREWPAKSAFIDRYCLSSWNAFGGLSVVGIRPEMRDEFYAVLDPRMRRMPKDLVLPFLPPKTRVKREAEMTTKQAKAYKQMDEHMVATIGDGEGDEETRVAATQPIARATRLMQFSSSFAELNDANEVRLSLPSNKVEALTELMEELPDDEPLVVFAQSRQLVHLAAAELDKRGVTYRLIVGGMTDAERDRSRDDFQNGTARVILLTIQAGGEGLTLTRARVVVFLQRSWSMLSNKQAEDRVHRIGSEQHDNILVVDVLAPGTIEEDQVEALHIKFQRLQEIVRDREALAAAAAGGDQDAARKLSELDVEENRLMNADLAREILGA